MLTKKIRYLIFNIILIFSKVIISFIGCSSILAWVTYKWTMRTFGSTLNFDQIIWALCNTTEGSDPKIIRSALTNATFGIFLCFLWCLLIICFNNKARSIRLKKFIKKCYRLFINSIFLPIKRVSESLQKLKYLNQACTVICLSLLAAISLLSLFNVLRLVDKNYEITCIF